MLSFFDTDAGRAWVATGDSRETSESIMRVIATIAANEDEAEAIWRDGSTRCRRIAPNNWSA